MRKKESNRCDYFIICARSAHCRRAAALDSGNTGGTYSDWRGLVLFQRKLRKEDIYEN